MQRIRINEWSRSNTYLCESVSEREARAQVCKLKYHRLLLDTQNRACQKSIVFLLVREQGTREPTEKLSVEYNLVNLNMVLKNRKYNAIHFLNNLLISPYEPCQDFIASFLHQASSSEVDLHALIGVEIHYVTRALNFRWNP